MAAVAFVGLVALTCCCYWWMLLIVLNMCICSGVGFILVVNLHSCLLVGVA